MGDVVVEACQLTRQYQILHRVCDSYELKVAALIHVVLENYSASIKCWRTP